MPGFLEDLQKLHYGGDLTDIAQKISLEESRRALQKQALSRLGQVSKSIQSQQNPVAQTALPQVETLQSIASVPFMDTGTLQNVLMQSGQIESSVRGAILNSQINQQLVNSANTLSQHIQEQMNRLQQMSQNYKNLPPEQQGVWRGMLQQQLQTLGNLQAVYSNTVNMMKNLANILTPQEIEQQIGGIGSEALQLLARSNDPSLMLQTLNTISEIEDRKNLERYRNIEAGLKQQEVNISANKAALQNLKMQESVLKTNLNVAKTLLDEAKKNAGLWIKNSSDISKDPTVIQAQQAVDEIQQQLDELRMEAGALQEPPPSSQQKKKQSTAVPDSILNQINGIKITAGNNK
jgi:hypothetical protein